MGRSFAARVAGSLLAAIGLEELNGVNLADYEAIALDLARSPERLAAVRAKLAGNRTSHPLFDTARLCRHLESAYETMWDFHMKGRKPESFMVNRLAERSAS
jgi:predicted O-linked N-acetylglucosamine transferase (SPINDLY family)